MPEAPAIFLDRDGTLMHEVEYCSDPASVEIFAGVCEALRCLKARGYKLIVITNQSGIGRGYFDHAQYQAVAAELERQLGADLIDATYHCPHDPAAGCSCRKPQPGLVLQAAREHHIDLTRSYFIGDKASDLECGQRAGTRTVLVATGYGHEQLGAAPDHRAGTFTEAADLILSAHG